MSVGGGRKQRVTACTKLGSSCKAYAGLDTSYSIAISIYLFTLKSLVL